MNEENTEQNTIEIDLNSFSKESLAKMILDMHSKNMTVQEYLVAALSNACEYFENNPENSLSETKE